MIAPVAVSPPGVLFYRWWSSGETAVCALAKLSDHSDWAAYAAGVFAGWPLADCLRYVAEEGCKLTAAEAGFLFPEMVQLAERDGLAYRP